jgi:hypothetical protein
MKTNLHQNILEATRLTRAGRINEATSMLQGLLGGQTGSASSPGHAPGADPVRLPPGTERVKKTGGGSDQSDPLHAASLGSMKDTLGRWMKQMKSGQGMPDLGGRQARRTSRLTKASTSASPSAIKPAHAPSSSMFPAGIGGRPFLSWSCSMAAPSRRTISPPALA